MNNIGQKVAPDKHYLEGNMSMHLRVWVARGISVTILQQGTGTQLTIFIVGVFSKDQVSVDEGQTLSASDQ